MLYFTTTSPCHCSTSASWPSTRPPRTKYPAEDLS
jgi:hypothetical protein